MISFLTPDDQCWLCSLSRLLPGQTEESPDSDCSTVVQGSIQGSSIVCERKAERPSVHSEHSPGEWQTLHDSRQTMGCSLMILSEATSPLKNKYYFQNLAKNKIVNNKVPQISYGIAALNRSFWFTETLLGLIIRTSVKTLSLVFALLFVWRNTWLCQLYCEAKLYFHLWTSLTVLPCEWRTSSQVESGVLTFTISVTPSRGRLSVASHAGRKPGLWSPGVAGEMSPGGRDPGKTSRVFPS